MPILDKNKDQKIPQKIGRLSSHHWK